MQAFGRVAAIAVAVAMLTVPAGAFAQATPNSADPKSAPPPAVRGAQSRSGEDKAAPKKSAPKMTRRQEIDHAIETRTVPSRYRSSVPKEYQKYIPFAK